MLSRFGVVLVLGTLLFSACDSAPGLPEPAGRAPLVTDLTVTPDALRRDAISAEWVDGDTARVPMTVSARASDPDGEIEQVQVVVLSTTNTLRPLTAAPMTREGDRYTASFTLPLPLLQPGLYAIVVVARDGAGQTGQVLGRLAYTRVNNPPVVESVAYSPDPFPVGGGLLTLTARVTDPQGLEDLVRVAATSPGGTFRLFDDGRSFGDLVAGDSVFTAQFAIPAGATSEDLTFDVQATDRAGLESETVRLVVTVQ